MPDVASRLHCRGWFFRTETDHYGHRYVRVGLEQPPDDNRNPGRRLRDFSDAFLVDGRDDRWIIERAFATVQFLSDHELREQFTVDGERVFEAHDPSVTGEQHDWFVERQSALRGY